MNSKYEIKYIRTIVESGERGLGSLPGTVDEKFNPFMIPLYDKLDELIPMSQSKYLETSGIIEALPVNFFPSDPLHSLSISSCCISISRSSCVL